MTTLYAKCTHLVAYFEYETNALTVDRHSPKLAEEADKPKLRSKSFQ
jgi:hypothetical protein